MALRAILLRSRLDAAKAQLETLREKSKEFEKREEELTAAIEEMTGETPDEDREEIEKKVETFQGEKGQHEEEVKALEEKIEELEGELDKEERMAPQDTGSKRKETMETMETRAFFGMNHEERSAFFADENVKGFLGHVRTCIKEKRELTNVGLTIPEVMLPLLRQVASESSKLMRYVYVKPVKGTARQNIMGTIPEGIWMEMTESLSELSLAFNDTEVDGYKVGGYFAVANSILEDSDLNLASELLTAIGKAIGKAIDKAIVYGTNTKQPLGFVTRLAQTTAPNGYSATAREWVDLHTSNVKAVSAGTGKTLFTNIIKNSVLADHKDYSNGDLVWIMNKKTRMNILAESMGANVNATLVAGMNNVMPVIGGNIVELSFMADNDIAFGYLDLYLLAERAGTNLAQSEHYRFVEDQTVFRGTARYDGKPVIPEAFAIININNEEPTTSLA